MRPKRERPTDERSRIEKAISIVFYIGLFWKMTRLLVRSIFLLVFPWTYFVDMRSIITRRRWSERADVRVVWVPVVFYLIALTGTYLLPVDNVFAFHLYFVYEIATGGLDFFTTGNGPLFAVILVLGVIFGSELSSQTKKFQYNVLSGDSLVMPLTKVYRSSKHTAATRLRLFDPNMPTLLAGASGSGKTNAAGILAQQIRRRREDDEAVVLLDYKTKPGSGEVEDYVDVFDEEDIVRISFENSTQYWNIFEEAGGEADFREISEKIVESTDVKTDNEYFQSQAAIVFSAILKSIYREQGSDASNEYVVETLDKSAEKLHKGFEYHGLTEAAEALNPEEKERVGSIKTTLNSSIKRIFEGDFEKGGGFSVKEYMEDPDGRVLVLDFDNSKENIIEPIFALMIYLCIEKTMERPRADYFILDEVSQLPDIPNMQKLITASRSRNTFTVLGVQSVAQLKNKYGAAGAESLESSLSQEILLRPEDPATREYMMEELGEEEKEEAEGLLKRAEKTLTGWQERKRGQYYRNAGGERKRTEAPITTGEMNSFDTGEGVIRNNDGWVWGKTPHRRRTMPYFARSSTEVPKREAHRWPLTFVYGRLKAMVGGEKEDTSDKDTQENSSEGEDDRSERDTESEKDGGSESGRDEEASESDILVSLSANGSEVTVPVGETFGEELGRVCADGDGDRKVSDGSKGVFNFDSDRGGIYLMSLSDEISVDGKRLPRGEERRYRAVMW